MNRTLKPNDMNLQELTLKDLDLIADFIYNNVYENEEFNNHDMLVDKTIEFDVINKKEGLDFSIIMYGNFFKERFTVRDCNFGIQATIFELEINTADETVSLTQNQLRYLETKI